jgi:valyl-tRNA synthetase
MRKELSKIYDPKSFEDKIYKNWEENDYFKAVVDKNKEPFTIVIPPPNVTGQLHMGHALDDTLQDILIRYKRMKGFSALWLPGTDHAGIATQIKVEEALRNEEGLSKYDLGREKFLERVWDWKHKYGGRIIEQLKKLGSSCDWSRERFTMDEGCSRAVKEVFVRLYEKGYIYKGNRIINWCPDCITALSDAEVEYSPKEGHFWHIKYPVKNSDEFVVIATTRPETLLGDTAVAVNPDDERYSNLVGKMLVLPLVGREIPVIADSYVEKDFGTGCVKITPAHDPNDFEVGKRHSLEIIKIMNDDATINSYGGKYEGLDRFEARKAMLSDLEEQGLLVKIEEHSHNVGECYRCGTVVEPISSSQWFVKMEPLAKEAIEVVNNGTIQFVPDRFSKTYLNWMENVHDWCISRQLWWGHRIPAFYCEKCDETVVSKENSVLCPKCGGEMKQESDVLDTWFSSALWPFSTLGWPDETEDLKYFYPTSVLVTGYDIIFFWVARMIFSGMEQMGKEPFRYVFIHGIVRDSQGRKMSKSLGNGIDPLEIIDLYGADALRFTLVTGNSPGNDMRFYTERVEASRNFANKIWNASRFVLMNLTIDKINLNQANLEPEDKWILSKYNKLVLDVNDNIEKFELGMAVSKLYDFIWNVYCDWYIEMVKPRLMSGNDENAQTVLTFVMSGFLKLLHPFMPFITEEIYGALPDSDETIMISSFPEFDESLSNLEIENSIDSLIDLITSIRNIRSEMNVPPKNKTKLYIISENQVFIAECQDFLIKLTYSSELIFIENKDAISEKCVSVVANGLEVLIPLNELIDKDKELIRLTKEKEFLQKEIDLVRSKLNNKGFIDKAPEKLVNIEKEKEKSFLEKLSKVEQAINEL